MASRPARKHRKLDHVEDMPSVEIGSTVAALKV